VLDRQVDISADELETRIQTGIDDRLKKLISFTQRIPVSEHWQALQNRYAEMLSTLTDEFRWSSSDKQTFQKTAIDPNANQLQVPQTLAELLQTKRDLDIANPPDLNVLLADLQQEINGDYNRLPFKWRIVLLGADLEKDGITKNQRPGPGPADPNCKLVWVVASDPDNPTQQAILITTRAAAEKKSYQLPDSFVN